MQTTATLPILQTVNDVTTHYLGLQPALKGSTTAEYVNPGLSFNPASNTLSVAGNVNVIGSLSGQMNGVSILDNTMSGDKISNVGKLAERVWIVPYPAPGNNVNIDISNGAIQFFTANSTANMSLNLRGNVTTAFNNSLLPGQSITTVVLLTHGATQFSSNVYIDGVLQAPKWLGNSKSTYTASLTNSVNESLSITAIKTGNATYTVLASTATFASPSATN
jgi:hypothetical protein